MTYFGFLLRFLVIPILILLVLTRWDPRKGNPIRGFRTGRALWAAIGVHVLLAVAYTTPWDNYLVATGVWYYNPDLVTGLVMGYVPIEEYTFFVLETLLAGLWWWFVARRLSPPPQTFTPNRPFITLSAGFITVLWLLFTCLFLFGSQPWAYLSIILFWALPPTILQMLFGADILWHYRKLVFWGFFIPGLYLSLVDIVALQDDRGAIVWDSSDRGGSLLLRHEHPAHIRNDPPACTRLSGQAGNYSRLDPGVERTARARGSIILMDEGTTYESSGASRTM
jgi:lycopene cyclase domain-containing protein